MSEQVAGDETEVGDPGWPGSLRVLVKNPIERVLTIWLVVIAAAAVVAVCLGAFGVVKVWNGPVYVLLAAIDWVVGLLYFRALTQQMRQPKEPPTGLIRASRWLIVVWFSSAFGVGLFLGTVIGSH